MRLNIHSALVLIAVLPVACRPRTLSQKPQAEEQSIQRSGELSAENVEEAIRTWDQRTGEEPLKCIEWTPIPDSPGMVLARCDSIPSWEGFFAVYGVRGGRVEWQASCDHEPEDQFVRKVRAITLKGFQGPIIEVYGETHCGNGSLCLYALRGRALTRIFKTRAVDENDSDSLVLEHAVLSPEYRDVNADGYDDIVLSGVLRGEGWVDSGSGIDDKEANLSSATPCREEFWWDPDQSVYVENENYRVGFIGGWK